MKALLAEPRPSVRRVFVEFACHFADAIADRPHVCGYVPIPIREAALELQRQKPTWSLTNERHCVMVSVE